MAVKAPWRGGVGEEVDNEQIGAALGRILDGQDFKASPRLAQMLTFIVEETLAGRGPYLKAFYIANKVFGRDENFDAVDRSARARPGQSTAQGDRALTI